MFSLGFRKYRFKTPLNCIDHPVLKDSKKEKEEINIYFQKQKKRVQKKMIYEIESLMAVVTTCPMKTQDSVQLSGADKL